MSKRRFTEEEVKDFRANPNVERVSPLSIRFTGAFQRKACAAYREGHSVIEIFQEAGFDVSVLGLSRIYGFRQKLQGLAERESIFLEEQSRQETMPAEVKKESVEQRVRRLEHELVHTRQEVEFLKKLQTVNTEAQKRWETRRQRK